MSVIDNLNEIRKSTEEIIAEKQIEIEDIELKLFVTNLIERISNIIKENPPSKVRGIFL